MAFRGPAGVFLLLTALLAQGFYPPWLAAAGGALAALYAARRSPLPLGPAGWWLPWLGWCVVAAAASPQPWAGLAPAAKWGAALLFYAAASEWDAREREAWTPAVLAAGVLLGAAGAWTGLRAGHYSAAHGLLFSGDSRDYGYTAFAVMAAAAAGLGAAGEPSAPRRLRLAGGAAAVLGLLYLSWARSRGAMLGLLVAAALVAARRHGLKRTSLGMALLLGAALLAPGAAERLLKRDSSTQWGRLDHWRSAAASASEAPLHGWGPGNYRLGYLRHPVPSPGPARWLYASDHAHSEPLQAAAETGWAGAALWALAFALSLSALARPAPGAPGAAAGPAAAGMSAMLLVDNVLQVPGLAFLYFSALACAGDPRLPWRFRVPRPVVLPLGLLLAAGPLSALQRDASGGESLEDRVWRHAHALEFFPADDGLRARQALLYERGGALRLADASWAQAAELSPYNAVYPFRRALLHERSGDWRSSERLHARAVELEPQFRDARLGRAVSLWRLRRGEQARAELAAAKALADPGPQGYPYADIVASRDPARLAAAEALLRRPAPAR